MENFASHQDIRGRPTSLSSVMGLSTPESDLSLPFEENLTDLVHDYRTNEESLFVENAKRRTRSIDSIGELIRELKEIKINQLQQCEKVEKDLVKSLTPLHIAAVMGDASAVERLVREGGYDVDPLSKDQRTPLIMACSSGKTDTIRTLVHLGANVNACS